MVNTKEIIEHCRSFSRNKEELMRHVERFLRILGNLSVAKEIIGRALADTDSLDSIVRERADVVELRKDLQDTMRWLEGYDKGKIEDSLS